jgi:two-component system sensor histidine kinase DegS
MILGHSQPCYFSYDKLEFINLVWSIVLPAIQEKTENQSLWNENRRLLAFQEEFRGKLAKELHDGPAQSLSSLAMRLDIARRMIERDGAQSIDELSKAENLIKQTAQDLRYLLILTRPLKIEPDGLPAFLECYAEKVSALFDLDVTIKTEGNFDDLPEIWLQNELFHLVEELVSNARKSTLTKHIWVRIIKKSDSITLDVDDDGEPFDMDRFSTSNQQSNFSLIDAHVNRLGGTANASPSIKGGTNVHIVLPVKSQN